MAHKYLKCSMSKNRLIIFPCLSPATELYKPETCQSPFGMPPHLHISLATSLLDVTHSLSTLFKFLYDLVEAILH